MYITDQSSHYTYIDKVTVSGEELLDKLKQIKPNWTSHTAKKIEIAVTGDCLVLLNNTDEILIKEQYGLVISYEDKDIKSLKPLTSGVGFYAIIAY